MFQNIFKNRLTTNRYRKLITQINKLEDDLKFLSDDELKLKSLNLKKQYKNTNDLKSLLPECFALTREASWRKVGLKHYDVQLIGGIALNNGKIAEMKTGEGKTLVATLPASLNALTGGGVHIVTVNDYLANRDQISMSQIYRFLGLSTGLIEQGMSSKERAKNYKADITYVTNYELVFDFLRDNMAITTQELALRPFNYCIIDEVDSILIDEAQTPLIISKPVETLDIKYVQASEVSKYLRANIHYKIDEKNKNIILTEKGTIVVEKILLVDDLYDPLDPWIPYIINAIKAKCLYFNNVNYIIQNQRIIIVDEFTGRVMPDRRWGDGLHQALEAKEELPIRKGTEALASITYQNFFLSYPKLSGMTGTAKTSEIEFEKIYKLSVEVIPTARPNIRKDLPDLIYRDQLSKWNAIAKTCETISKQDQPILIGTTTVEKSEMLAQLLKEYKLEYQILNAKPENVRKESEIVAQAGKKKAITIATNMAGRGTDIILGGNLKFKVQKELYEILTTVTNFQESGQNFVISKIFDSYTGISQKFLSILISLSINKKFLSLTDVEVLKLVIEDDQISTPLIDYQCSIKFLIKEFTSFNQKQHYQENKIVKNLGGLYIIGTERNDSQRIDNQLRGRCGRQGDPGTSRFFLSIDDTILRLFGDLDIQNYIQNGLFEDDPESPLESRLITRSLDSAQQKIEEKYYEQRKNLFEYDEVLNKQRRTTYYERRKVLEAKTVKKKVIEYAEQAISEYTFYLKKAIRKKKFKNLTPEFLNLFIFRKNYRLIKDFSINSNLFAYRRSLYAQFWTDFYLKKLSFESYESFESTEHENLFETIERRYLLLINDLLWQEHLQRMSLLREAVGWRGYGQRNPLYEYKEDAYFLFQDFQVTFRHLVLYHLKYLEIV